jgi:hypothetical protein
VKEKEPAVVMASANGSTIKLQGESPPKMEKAPAKALSPKGEKLTFATTVTDLAQAEMQRGAEELVWKLVKAQLKDSRWLPFCIRTLNSARVELVGDSDVSFSFDIAWAEREFLAAAIYRLADAVERCWRAITLSIRRVRFMRKQVADNRLRLNRFSSVMRHANILRAGDKRN